MKLVRSQESEEDHEATLAATQERQARLRGTETPTQRESRLTSYRFRRRPLGSERIVNSVRRVYP